MDNLSKYIWLLFLFLTKLSFGQDTTSLTSKAWLSLINKNSINKPLTNKHFYEAPAGYALYFSKADTLFAPYLVYVPKEYNPLNSYPLVVYLHGGIVSIDSFEYKDPEFAEEPIFSIADKYDVIVLFPYGEKKFGWVKQPAAFQNVMNEISKVEETYNIDKQNIFLGGMSNGGSAVFWFITNHPEIFRAFYAFSGMPKLYHSNINYKNITTGKPLYSINAKDDEVFSFDAVKSIYEKHKIEASGWHFDSAITGNHGFIYGDSGFIIITSLFDKLHIKNIYQEKLYDSIRQVLLRVDGDDQQYRNQIDAVRVKYGGDSKEMKSLFQNMAITDSANLITAEDIINKFGWLGAKKIGDQANTALFMVVQHNDLTTQEKYLPILRKAVEDGNAEPRHLALLEDRVAIKEGKLQIYGSQLSWNLKTNKYIIFPMIDPDKVDERRKAARLSSYADYLKGFDIIWNAQQYKKELPEIEKQFKSKK